MSYRNDTSIIPIGAVIDWFGSITGCPALPKGWQLCDGSAITDARSPMNGQNTPTLNSGVNRMTRGNTTSGGTGGADTHTLAATEMPAHTHTLNPTTIHGLDVGAPGMNGWGPGGGKGGAFTLNNAGGLGGLTQPHNNLPGYTNAIKIIRIF
jgi:microcystin-dependent protein